MKTNKDANAINRGLPGKANNSIFQHDFSCYVPHYNPNFPHQTVPKEQKKSRVSTQLSCTERSVSVKDIYAQNVWFSDLGVKVGIDVPILNTVGFQKRNTLNIVAQRNDLLYRPHVLSAKCNKGTERHPETG